MATDVRRGELAVGRELFPDHILGAPPAVAQPFILKLDSAFLWRPLAARFTLTTDVNVANRLVTVDFCDGEGNPWIRYPAPAVQAAGVANQEYNFAERELGVSGIAAQPQFATLHGYWLPLGWQLRVNVAAIQAGDQLDNLRIYVEKLVSDES